MVYHKFIRRYSDRPTTTFKYSYRTRIAQVGIYVDIQVIHMKNHKSKVTELVQLQIYCNYSIAKVSIRNVPMYMWCTVGTLRTPYVLLFIKSLLHIPTRTYPRTLQLGHRYDVRAYSVYSFFFFFFFHSYMYCHRLSPNTLYHHIIYTKAT